MYDRNACPATANIIVFRDTQLSTDTRCDYIQYVNMYTDSPPVCVHRDNLITYDHYDFNWNFPAREREAVFVRLASTKLFCIWHLSFVKTFKREATG